MKLSKYLSPTLKESPREAEVISHKLLVRAGMIRKVASGLYSYLPMGLKVLKKVEEIVRKEMNKSGAVECLLPLTTPAELWKRSGRWEKYGKELLRFEDRHANEFCFGPTFEESITDLANSFIQSYKQLPINLYQIGPKFRDEVRPRFGLMRGREFVMKDAYSFHETNTSLDETFKNMQETYSNIFDKCGLEFKDVEADSGAIGGSGSKEFMVTADTGEDAIVVCDSCNYAGNTEAAGIMFKGAVDQNSDQKPEIIDTPGVKTIKDIASFLGVKKSDTVKTLIYEIDGTPSVFIIRGDREINEIKIKSVFNAEKVAMVTNNKFNEITGVNPGSAGPINLKVNCAIYADFSIQTMKEMIVGANEEGKHLSHVVIGRDVTPAEFGDYGTAKVGDICAECKNGSYTEVRGIEVGHIFKLGDIYTSKLDAKILNEAGQEKSMIMGCYGIGVSRIMAAAVEQNHDEKGIVWPKEIAPFRAVIIMATTKDEEIVEEATSLYETLKEEEIDCILDDRKSSLGAKFKDAELIGYPTQIVVGKSFKSEGVYEVIDRKTGERENLDKESVLKYLK